MNRKKFLTLVAGSAGLAAMGSIKVFGEMFREEDTKMPVLFVGHGSPMNGIEEMYSVTIGKNWHRNSDAQSGDLCFRALAYQGHIHYSDGSTANNS
jgi:hypothetical protein